MRLRKLLLLASFTFASTVFFKTSAQLFPSQFYIEHLSIPAVIKSTYIADVEQDEYGLLWFGTSSGLFHFDGNKFIAHSFKTLLGVSLEARQINTLLWDVAGHQLYIGTRTGGLLKYRYNTNTISLVASDPETINALAQTADGRMWAVTPDGLFEIADDTLKLIADAAKLKNPSTLFTDNNKLLVGGVLQTTVYEDGLLIKQLPLQVKERVFSSATRISALLVDSHKQLWMGTEREGIIVTDYVSGKIIKQFLPNERPYYSRINQIYEDKNGWIWILTKAEGIVVYNPKTNQTRYLRQDLYEENSLSGNTYYSIIEDRNGILWTGSNGNIDYFDPTQRKFEHFAHNPYNVNSLSDNMVRSIYTTTDDKLWVGTDAGFINIVDPTKKTIERIKVKGTSLPKQEAIVPFAFAVLPDGTQLVGTSVGLLTLQHKQFDYYKPLQTIIKNKRVRQLLVRDNFLYAIVQGAFFEYNLATHVHAFYTVPIRKNVTALAFDSKSRLWVGSNSAVSIFDRTTKKFTSKSLPFDSANFMILDIHQVADRMMVSTMNQGVFEVQEVNNEISILENIRDQNGLVDNTVYTTLPDAFGNVWFATNRGLARKDATGTFTNYQVSEGLQAEEYNRFSYATLSTGQLVFGGINGLNIVDPNTVVTKVETVTPIILSALLRSETKQQNTWQEVSLLADTTVEISHDQNVLNISFGAANYQHPKRYKLLYKLENFDAAWFESANNIATYTNLNPGNYIFRVKAINSAGVARIKSILIHIQSPFWMTWWFRLLLSIAVLAIAVLNYRFRIQRDKKERIRLEELLKARTQEIEKSREELAGLNKKKDLIFSILSHDLRSPLTTLKGFLGLLIDDNQTFTREEVKKHAEQIRNSVSTSLDLIDNTLFWSLSQMGGIQYNPEKVQITKLTKKIEDLYQLASERKDVPMHIQVADNIFALADENMLYVMLRNLVSNALKFTPSGKEISVQASQNHGGVTISIKDEGVGMSKSYINKLLLQEHPVIKTGTSNEKGTGLGLILCQQFIQANKGTLTIVSEEGKGSVFTLSLPAAN
jgi:signal transduction histidine kinase/ligand-binding sensor domain-containing protein